MANPVARLFSICLIVTLTSCGFPRDSVLLKEFEENESTMDELAATVYREIADFDNTIPIVVIPGDVTASLKKNKKHQKLMGGIGLDGPGIGYSEIDQPPLFFRLRSASPSVLLGDTKGFAYVPTFPKYSVLDFLVSNTDSLDKGFISETHYYYRHIKGKWYIYREVVQ